MRVSSFVLTTTTPWLYSPCRTLASFTTIFQSSLLYARILQFVTPNLMSSLNPFPRPCRSRRSDQFLPLLGSWTMLFFPGWGCYPHAQPPAWRTRVSLLVWALPFDLSGMAGPTNSYATAGIALRVTESHKPPPLTSTTRWRHLRGRSLFLVILKCAWKYIGLSSSIITMSWFITVIFNWLIREITGEILPDFSDLGIILLMVKTW